MKKTILLLISLLILTAGYSQSERRKMFIGGKLNLNTEFHTYDNTASNYSVIDLNFAPHVGFFLSEKMAIGANLDLGVRTEDSQTFPVFGMGGFFRYYVKVVGNLSMFANAGMGFNYSSFMSGSNEISTSLFSLGITPGIEYLLSPNLGIEASIGFVGLTYRGTKTTNDYSGSTQTSQENAVGLGVSLDTTVLNFGFNFFLR